MGSDEEPFLEAVVDKSLGLSRICGIKKCHLHLRLGVYVN